MKNGNHKLTVEEAYRRSQANKKEFERRVKDGATPAERLHIYRQMVKQNRQRDSLSDMLGFDCLMICFFSFLFICGGLLALLSEIL